MCLYRKMSSSMAYATIAKGEAVAMPEAIFVARPLLDKEKNISMLWEVKQVKTCPQ